MLSTADISTIEFARARLRLRDDLRVAPQMYAGEPFYHFSSTGGASFYRVGWPEAVFISLLDGHTTFAAALASSSQTLGDRALSQQRAMELCSWLIEHGLATLTDHDAVASGAARTFAAPETGTGWTRFNPLWLRIPLGNPDRLLRALTRCFGWCFAPIATVLACLLTVVAMLVIHAHWQEFAADASRIVSVNNWLWLGLIGLLLKLVHELGHGIVCLRYGGSIREAGCVLAMLVPLPYVDATSAWAFRSRWQRIHTALAGVQVELVVASLAAIAWTAGDGLLTRQLLQNVVIMSSVSTVIFNLNPLMKFDGYFVLSDLLQIPNLSNEASGSLARGLRRVFLGQLSTAPRFTGRRSGIVLAYGVASMVWRVAVSASLLLTASMLGHGAGLPLAVFGLLVWFGRPVIRTAKTLWSLRLDSPERLMRCVSMTVALACVAVGLAAWLPAPVLETVPGVVDFADSGVVRAETEGFVESVLVTDGCLVKTGDVLVVLRNEDIVAELTSTKQKLEQELLRLQTAASNHDSPAMHIASGNVASLRKQVDECQRRFDALTLRAPVNGHIVARTIQQLPGTWLKTGTLVAIVGDPTQKELRLSVGQRELPRTLSLVGEPVRARACDGTTIAGTLATVDPQGSRILRDESLAATNGGPLDVDVSPNEDADEPSLRLADHRFQAVVALESQASQKLHCGQTVHVTLGLADVSLGRYVWRSIHDWMQSKLEALNPKST